MTKEILKAFEEDLVADGKAKKTTISYVGDVRDFLKWLNNKDVKFEGSIKRFFITQYKDYWISYTKWTDFLRKYMIIKLRRMIIWLKKLTGSLPMNLKIK